MSVFHCSCLAFQHMIVVNSHHELKKTQTFLFSARHLKKIIWPYYLCCWDIFISFFVWFEVEFGRPSHQSLTTVAHNDRRFWNRKRGDSPEVQLSWWLYLLKPLSFMHFPPLYCWSQGSVEVIMKTFAFGFLMSVCWPSQAFLWSETDSSLSVCCVCLVGTMCTFHLLFDVYFFICLFYFLHSLCAHTAARSTLRHSSL